MLSALCRSSLRSRSSLWVSAWEATNASGATSSSSARSSVVVAVLVLFVIIERYVAREPLMPMSVLFNRTPGFVAIACWFITMSQFGIIFNVPTYFQSVEQTTSSYAGLHLIPNAIIASSCSLGSGLYMARTGRYRKMLLLGDSSASWVLS